jgi:hypothetical protein
MAVKQTLDQQVCEAVYKVNGEARLNIVAKLKKLSEEYNDLEDLDFLSDPIALRRYNQFALKFEDIIVELGCVRDSIMTACEEKKQWLRLTSVPTDLEEFKDV